MNSSTKNENAGAATHAARLRRYVCVAATGATAMTGVAEAAVITSASVAWSGWSGSVNGAVVTSFVNQKEENTLFGDALLNGAFRAAISQFGGSQPSSNLGSNRLAYLKGIGAGKQVSRAFAGTGAQVNASLGNWFGTAVAARSSAVLAANTWQPRNDGTPVLGLATAAGADSRSGYLAFRISAGGSDYYYGYFEITMSRDGTGTGWAAGATNPSTFTMNITGWAYESTLNQGITIGGAAPVPGGAGLAALAVGAAGLRGRRRSRLA